jgi:O2-independent ubiquinone biosynthesis protein UbiU
VLLVPVPLALAAPFVRLLGEFVFDRFSCDESAGYPTICKGPLQLRRTGRALLRLRGAGQPQSLRSLAGPDARGRDRAEDRGTPSSRAYVKSVVSAFRDAVDGLMQGREAAYLSLLALTEGSRETQGAFAGKRWR